MFSLHNKKSRSRKLASIGLITMMLLVSACGNNNVNSSTNAGTSPTTAPVTEATQTPAAPKTVTDAMGHEVTIPANPERVLGSYLEDYLVTLGVTPVAQWSVPNGVQDYLSTELKDVPTISYDLPLEAVMSFTPDLILIGSESSVQNGIYDQLNKIAPTYVIGDELNQEWRKTLLKIGEILNKTTEAEKAIEEYEQKAAAAKEQLAGSIGKESVAILWLVDKNFYIVDETRSSGAVLYTDLGLTPPNLVTEIPADTRATWNPISLEKLSELTADHIFLVNSDKSEASEILNSAIWKGIPAVKAGNVYEMSSTSSWLYSGANAGTKIIDDALKSLVK